VECDLRARAEHQKIKRELCASMEANQSAERVYHIWHWIKSKCVVELPVYRSGYEWYRAQVRLIQHRLDHVFTDAGFQLHTTILVRIVVHSIIL
jgi:hypothetical protein